MSDQPKHESFDLPALIEAAVAAHELFKSYLAAGFSETQALRLTALIISNGGGQE